VSQPLSNEELQFLARLAKLPEGRRYMQYLSSRLADADQELRGALSEYVLQAQGRARTLWELLKDLQEAEARLERANGSRPSRAIV
jgi:hypothetical protein